MSMWREGGEEAARLGKTLQHAARTFDNSAAVDSELTEKCQITAHQYAEPPELVRVLGGRLVTRQVFLLRHIQKVTNGTFHRVCGLIGRQRIPPCTSYDPCVAQSTLTS